MLQFLSPDDIIFFIKSCFKFNKYGYLLAVFSSLRKCRNDWGIAAYSVEGLFDCKYLGVTACLSDELHHRFKALIGMMHKDVLTSDSLKDINTIHKGRHGLGLNNRCLKRRIHLLHSIELHEEGQVKRSFNVIYLIPAYHEFTYKDFLQSLISIYIQFQSDCLSPLALLDLFLYFLKEVGSLLLIYLKVGISHDSEFTGSYNLMIKKQLVQVLLNYLLKENKT